MDTILSIKSGIGLTKYFILIVFLQVNEIMMLPFFMAE